MRNRESETATIIERGAEGIWQARENGAFAWRAGRVPEREKIAYRRQMEAAVVALSDAGFVIVPTQTTAGDLARILDAAIVTHGQ